VTTSSGATQQTPNHTTDDVFVANNIASAVHFVSPAGGGGNNGQYLVIHNVMTAATSYAMTWDDAATGYTARYGPTLPTRTSNGSNSRTHYEFMFDTANSLNRWVITYRTQ
jgi:hypothetical protein